VGATYYKCQADSNVNINCVTDLVFYDQGTNTYSCKTADYISSTCSVVYQQNTGSLAFYQCTTIGDINSTFHSNCSGT
jgi:hypothetical protein